MKSLMTLVALSTVTTSALTLRERGSGNSEVLNVVQYDFERREVPGLSSLQRRQSVGVSLPAAPASIHYVINVTMGTPPQTFGLNLDTGSSDFVVRTSQSAGCMAGNCTAYGSFDPTKSSTYVPGTLSYTQKYGEGSSANGTMANDILSFGGVTVSNFSFAAVNQFNIDDNVFGVGYPTQEGIVITNISQPQYLNGASALKAAGLIQASAYSIWLNDISAGKGSVLYVFPTLFFSIKHNTNLQTYLQERAPQQLLSILYSLLISDPKSLMLTFLPASFGGVDTSKYTGPLQTVPVVPAFKTGPNDPRGPAGTVLYGDISISLDAIGTSKGSATTISTPAGFPLTVLLDTGTTLLQLPQQVCTNLCSAFGCTTTSNNGYTLPCNTAGNITFNFSGINITAPVAEFQRDLGFGGGQCSFDIQPINSGYILGEPFLRSAYVVFDLDNNEIALAQTVFNSSAPSNILEITNPSSAANGSSSTTFGIPNAVNASNVRQGIPSVTGTIGPAVTNAAAWRVAVDGGVGMLAVLMALWACM
ncbi:hypothetical protein MMC11_000913 [Xylographa trunciseda]|nr:hypothetical protein [Xylographa trunciseda]